MSVARTRCKAAWWSVLVALSLTLLAPLTLVDVPPLLDYPNHLARLDVLAVVGADPVLARFYQPHWAIIPNLGLDLTVPPLLRIFPVHLVGRAVIGIALLLPLFGAERIIVRSPAGCRLAVLLRPVRLQCLAAPRFSEFRHFGRPRAATRRRVDRVARLAAVRAILCGIAGSVALFFCHLTGLLFFAILIAAHELLVLRTDPFSVRGIARRCIALLVVFVGPVVLYGLWIWPNAQ